MHHDENYVRFLKIEYEKLANINKNESACAGEPAVCGCKSECLDYAGAQLAYRLRLYNILLKAIANELSKCGEGVD